VTLNLWVSEPVSQELS